MKDLSHCLRELAQKFSSPEAARMWMSTPHPLLGRSPLMALAEGRLESVYTILHQLPLPLSC